MNDMVVNAPQEAMEKRRGEESTAFSCCWEVKHCDVPVMRTKSESLLVYASVQKANAAADQ
eukprot:scaffold285_cov304-Pinguiococcus_pyrenoidosus.AAC.3